MSRFRTSCCRSRDFLFSLPCTLGLLLLACGGSDSSKPGGQPLPGRPPVIMVSIDTLRADHLPAYGYPDVDTPNIDRLRNDSVLFENAYSHSPLTLPSHLSVLSGLLPFEHGVRNNVGYTFDGERHPTLSRYLEQRGYTSGAAVSAYVLRGQTGIATGFDFYEDGIQGRDRVPLGALQRPGRLTVEAALRWIAGRAEEPFFFLLHLFEPHSPYDPPEPFRSRYRLAYDGEIASADAALGVFLDALVRLGVYDRAIIVLFSDHGEGLSQHGEGEHGIFLYREAIHVPLIIKLPDSREHGSSVTIPVQLVDLLPTIGELVGFDTPEELSGLSLTPLLSGGSLEKRLIYSETLYPRIHLGWSDLRSLIDDRFHFIQAPRPELYDIVADPGEVENVTLRERTVHLRMQRNLASLDVPVDMPSEIDPEELGRLAALGYLGSVSTESKGAELADPKDHIEEIENLRQAFILESQGRFEDAIAILRHLVERHPGFMDAWAKLALTLDTSGRWQEAIETYQQALAFSPSLAAEYALSLSSIHLKLGQFEEAISHAEFARRRHPAKAEILLGRIALEQGLFDLAEVHARAALEGPNERFSAAVLLVKALTAKQQFDEAMRIAREARQEAQDSASGPVQGLAFVYGDLLARSGQNQEAEEAFREEIRLFPRDRQAYANLALLLTTEGRSDEARLLLEQLGERNPSRRSYLFAAKTLEVLGDRRTAETWRRRAEAIGHGDSEAR